MENTAQFTKTISLDKYGIKNVQEIIYNPSFEFLYNEELNPNLKVLYYFYQKKNFVLKSKRNRHC